MFHQHMHPTHQHSPNSRDRLWKLRIALFGKGLHPRSSAGKQELVRPPPTFRAPAKVTSSRPQSPRARFMTLFAWCAPELRLSDEGVHAGNWPSIHGSLASSARASSSSSPVSSTYPSPPETLDHKQQHHPQQQQQDYTTPRTPAEGPVASAAATVGGGSRNPADEWHATATASANTSATKRPPEPYHTPSSRHEASSGKAQASTSSSNKPASTTPSRSRANTRTCNIHPDDVTIIAQIFRCSPAVVMNLHIQQQQHMMAYAQCVQQRPLHFLDDDFEESQAERQQKQQQRRVTFPQEHQPALHPRQQQRHQQSWDISPQQPVFQQQHNTSAQQQEHQQFQPTFPQQSTPTHLPQQQQPPWAQDPLTYGILEPYWRPIEDLEPAHVPQRRRRTTSEIMRMRVEVGFNFHAIGSPREYRSRQGRLNRSGHPCNAAYQQKQQVSNGLAAHCQGSMR